MIDYVNFPPPDVSWRRFVQDIDEEPDMDRRTVVRFFSGRMTKGRWKRLDRWCRKQNWRTRCGHEWDCCGCNFMQSCYFTYKHNQVAVYVTSYFNY